jgi:hypothetical protein
MNTMTKGITESTWYMPMINIQDEDFNDRCDQLLDNLYQTYHAYHYDIEPIDRQLFEDRYEARKRRKEIRFKQLQLERKRKYGRR